jgi:hypothetical protein
MLVMASYGCGQSSGSSEGPPVDASTGDRRAPDASSDGAKDGGDGAKDGGGSGEAGVVEVPLTGCYETHTLPVTIGGTQTFHLNLDTGASTLGVASTACASCADAGVSPLYAPGASATNLGRPVTLMYAPDFGWSGEAYRDTVSIGGVSTSVELVAITSASNYFYPGACDTPDGSVPGPYDGTIGFGVAASILPGTNEYFDQAIETDKVANAFAVAFCHVDGTLWLGGYDPASIVGPLAYTPMGMGEGYTVEWADVIVDGTDIALPVGTQATTDSGGDYLIVPPGLFASIATALEGDAAFAGAFGASFLSATAEPNENCMTLSKTPAEIDAELPAFTVKLGEKDPIQVSLNAAESYLAYSYVGPSQVQYCQSIIVAPETEVVQYYLGMSLMLGRVLVHDRANARFGLAPLAKACPF